MSLGVGLVGARGHVGQELVKLLMRHPMLELAWVSSSSRAGEAVADVMDGVDPALRFVASTPETVAGSPADVVVLALPNGLAADYVAGLSAQTLVLDLSADYRFDDAWTYALPECGRGAIGGARRISNPGCYATAMQLGLFPVRERLATTPSCFGVSGFSGAGTKPGPRNDPQRLKDNLLPYALAGHIHEREVSRQLGRPVRFMPHVAPWFRGITMTISARLNGLRTAGELHECFADRYANEPLIDVLAEPPEVASIACTSRAQIGGFTVHENGVDAAWVVTLDNLLKGAASQALQNINLALGLNELNGVGS